MQTNLEYIKEHLEETLIDIVVNRDRWLNQIGDEYCKKICPHFDGSKCLLDNDCKVPLPEEMLKLWLHAEA